HLGRLTVGYVHPERALLTGLAQDGRRQGARPVRALVRSPRCVAFRLVSGGDAQRCPDRNQGAFRDANSATAPIVVLSRDPESSRKFDQRRRQSAHTDILLVEMSGMRPECSPRRRLFCELGLLRAVRCAATISSISPHLINGRGLAPWRQPLPACPQRAAASKHSPGEVAWGALPLSV